MQEAILSSAAIHRAVWLGGCWIALAAAWAAACTWGDRDARYVFGSQTRWPLVMAAPGVGLLVSAALLGFAGLSALLATLVCIGAAYLWQREATVLPPHRILTASRATSLLKRATQRSAARGPAASGPAAARPAAGRDDDGGVMLLRRDGTPPPAPPRGRRHRQAARTARAARDLVAEAVSARATRLQIDSRPEGRARVRFEIDGSWRPHARLGAPEGGGLAHEFRTLAGLSRDGRRRRRAGFTAVVAGRTIEFRGCSEPRPRGMRLAFEILDPDANCGRHDFRAGLDGTGLPRQACESIRAIVQQPRGMLVFCGPAGSGRTTTAYAVIAEIDPRVHPIVTIEESIAARIEHVAQTAVDPAAGLTAARLLSGLRPGDAAAVLLDGIRDRDTADAAVQASGESTVLATLEAEDAADAVMKLLALGIDPRTLGTAVAGVVAQRLVRVLCDQCKVPSAAPREFLRKLPEHDGGDLVIFRRSRAGCPACHETGYRGRVPVHEVLLVDEPLRILLADRPTRGRIRTQARRSGMRTLRESAIALVASGVTSVKEVVRVVP
jgi:type II secretory ATPase GspE/PulE/Tfp pilus assembly ATPase PilB-like protein